MIRDLKKLEEEGIDIQMSAHEFKNYKGSMLFWAGDTPAQASIGGFKESVSAYRFCRTCTITKEDWLEISHEKNLNLRNLQQHEDELSIVLDDTITKAAREY